MYEGWKQDILQKVGKSIDKEVNDCRSWTIEGIERNSNIDNFVRDYLRFHVKTYGSNFTWRVPSKRLLDLIDVNYLRKETPKQILKANLLYRYWHHYFKKYYNTILEEAK